jgi:amidase
MIQDDDYVRHDAVALATLVRQREVSASELLEAALARIERLNPALNAVVRTRHEAARAEAAAVDRSAPLAGVPFLVKDLLATIAGEPTSGGNHRLAQVAMPRDSEMVRRYRSAGLVMAGRTNTPEFGLTPYTESTLLGPARNPWNPAHTPGGSSGGSAAAVAARMVPVASGGDGGGSIRIPAACCGLFGFKPSRGATPTGPMFGELWHGFAIEHAISRSVRDSAALLDATAGADGGAPYAAPHRERPYVDEVRTDPGRLRIGFTSQPFFGQRVHNDCLEGLRFTARLLESLGHEVEEAAPRAAGDELAQAYVTVLAGEVRAEIDAMAGLLGRAPKPDDFEPATWCLGLLGRSFSAAASAGASRKLQLAARRMAPYFERHDLLLTPTLAAPPPRIGELLPTAAETRAMRAINALGAGWLMRWTGTVKQMADRTFDFMPYTPLFNATGQPAMSVPLVWNGAGLPIGMHLVGRLGDDARLFRLAGQLEQARPWRDKVAPGY